MQQLDYTKQNFQNNKILSAEQLNSIEDQTQEIVDTQNQINMDHETRLEDLEGLNEIVMGLKEETEQIKTNTNNIETNKNNIATNAEKIEENSTNIATNTNNINALNDIVFENRTYLLIGDSYGVSDYGSNGDNYGGSWADYFIRNFTSSTKTHKYICWAGAGFCNPGQDNVSPSTNFEVSDVFGQYITSWEKFTDSKTFNSIINGIKDNYGLDKFTDVVILAGWNDKGKTINELSNGINSVINCIRSVKSDIRIYLGMISWFTNNYDNCDTFYTQGDPYGLSGRKTQNNIAKSLFGVEDVYKRICCQYKNVIYLTGIEQQFRRNPEGTIGPDGLHPISTAKQSIAKTLYNCLSEGNANLPDIRRIYLIETYCDEDGWYWEKWSNGIAKIYRFSKKDMPLVIKTEATGGGYASEKIELSFPKNLRLKSIIHLGPFAIEHKYDQTPWGQLNFEYCGFLRNETTHEIEGIEGYYFSNAEREMTTPFNYSFSIIGTWRSTAV